MSEAQAGCAWLEDVEESTFIRFSQFAYTGDYNAADPEILLSSSNIASTIPEPPTIETDSPVAFEEPVMLTISPPTMAPDGEEAEKPINLEQISHYASKSRRNKLNKFMYHYNTEEGTLSSRREQLWKIFESLTYNVPGAPKYSFHPRKNLESCEDYKDVFLSHARLYVFAEKYDISPLKMLSLSKLHKTLSVFTLWKERVEDIVALIRYSYANTVHRPSSNDPLRLLVIHFATCVVEKLVKSSEFTALLEEPGELASDLVVKMIHRLD